MTKDAGPRICAITGDGLDVADRLNLWFINDTPVVYPAQDNSHPAAHVAQISAIIKALVQQVQTEIDFGKPLQRGKGNHHLGA